MDNINYTKNKNITDKKLWIFYIIIFSLILLPNIRLNGIPSFRVEQLVITILALVSSLRILLGKKIRISNSFFVISYIGLSFFIFLSILVGSFKGIRVITNDFFELYKIFIYLGIFILTTSLIITDENRIRVIKFMNFCLLISVIIALQQYFDLFSLNEKYVSFIAPTQYKTLVNNYAYPRVIGMTPNPNEYSVMPGIGGVLSWSLFILTKNKKYILYLLCFVLAVLMTLSRTGLVFLILSILSFSFFYLFENFSKRKGLKVFKILITTSSLLLIAFIIFQYLPQELTWRFKAGMNISMDNSFQARLSNWNEHINYFKMSPIFGLGPAKSISYEHSVDNEWLLFLRQYGIVGCFYIFFIFTIPFLRLKRTYFKHLYFAIIIGSAIYMIPAAIYNSFQLMPLIMIFAGLIPKENKILSFFKREGGLLNNATISINSESEE